MINAICFGEVLFNIFLGSKKIGGAPLNVASRLNSYYKNGGYAVDVIDTVGSGDSFLATLIHTLFKGKSPQKAINKACALGAIVANREGANPIVSEKEINIFLKRKTK